MGKTIFVLVILITGLDLFADCFKITSGQVFSACKDQSVSCGKDLQLILQSIKSMCHPLPEAYKKILKGKISSLECRNIGETNNPIHSITINGICVNDRKVLITQFMTSGAIEDKAIELSFLKDEISYRDLNESEQMEQTVYFTEQYGQ